MNTIKWSPKALKQARKLGQPISSRIFAAVDTELADLAHAQNVRALVNYRYPYRLRVGDFRVFFAAAPSGLVQIITIEEVRKRNERTY